MNYLVLITYPTGRQYRVYKQWLDDAEKYMSPRRNRRGLRTVVIIPILH
jgi:hypothetical protein